MSAPGRPATPTVPSGLVTLVVGDTTRTGASRARSRAAAGARSQPQDGKAASPWTFWWSSGGPGPVPAGRDGQPDLTLTLSPGDAQLVKKGELEPSVAFMQGKLKTSGDNALLLSVLAWSTTPAFADAFGRSVG